MQQRRYAQATITTKQGDENYVEVLQANKRRAYVEHTMLDERKATNILSDTS